MNIIAVLFTAFAIGLLAYAAIVVAYGRSREYRARCLLKERLT